MENKELKDVILATVSDLALDFVEYERREDEDLSEEQLREAIEDNVITIDEIVAEFKKSLIELI